MATPIGTAEIRVLVITAADILGHEHPMQRFTEARRMVLARKLTEGTYPQHEALLTAMPVIEREITAPEYALLLRRVAEQLDVRADQVLHGVALDVVRILMDADRDRAAMKGARR
ncbi:hypothetical protein [Streptomyces albidoflavus]|uniref:hypothetical protein n=1 Tax=Streptomyces albidoflavus TaxID=1886 RepID=UPI00386404F9|nr:hypothetical protein OG525_23840 [Streptomyces albidoflavus]